MRKTRGSLGTKNMAANRERAVDYRVFQRIWSVINARGKLKLGKKMLDYIINPSCDEKRVVDVVDVGHL